jgi:hypothetical protein
MVFPYYMTHERMVQCLLHYLSGDQHHHTCFSHRGNLYKLHRSCHKGHTAVCEGSRQVSFVFNEVSLWIVYCAGKNSLNFSSFFNSVPAASLTKYILPSLPVSSLQQARVHHHGARRYHTLPWSPPQVPGRYRCG